MMIKSFGVRVETVWETLRPMTKKLLAKVMKLNEKASRKRTIAYDAHADWEISRLLDALDEQAQESEKETHKTKLEQMNQLADVCASVLEEKTVSAEIFIQLAKRALARNDYARVDALADILLERFSTSEIAEVIRQTDIPQIRAVAYETLAVTSTFSIAPLLKDPLYFEIACNVLEQQMIEFENPEAGRVLEQMSPGGLNFG